MEILAVIPARGGSKGVPNKNIRLFAGKPLLAHTIKSAKQSERISRVIVSTESPKIAEVAKRYGAEVPFLRPANLASDSSLVADAMADLLARLKSNEGYAPDVLVLLQPTSPLRASEDIDATIDLFFRRRAPAALTVCRTEHLLFTLDKRDRLRLQSNPAFGRSSNRQALPAVYKFDGCAVYVIRPAVLLKKRTFAPPGTVAHVLPRWRAVDIDEPEDFAVGEIIHRNRKKIQSSLEKFL